MTLRTPGGRAERDADDDGWLDDLLRAARPGELDDAGFSAAVLARVAAPHAWLTPSAALAAAHRAEARERLHAQWSWLGVLVGLLVAVCSVFVAGPPAPIDTGLLRAAPALALSLAFACLGAFALLAHWDAPAH